MTEDEKTFRALLYSFFGVLMIWCAFVYWANVSARANEAAYRKGPLAKDYKAPPIIQVLLPDPRKIPLRARRIAANHILEGKPVIFGVYFKDFEGTLDISENRNLLVSYCTFKRKEPRYSWPRP